MKNNAPFLKVIETLAVAIAMVSMLAAFQWNGGAAFAAFVVSVACASVAFQTYSRRDKLLMRPWQEALKQAWAERDRSRADTERMNYLDAMSTTHNGSMSRAVLDTWMYERDRAVTP